ncbi:HD domain-containing phosphohydrolase [Magnetococcus sp. PR-3]|uniref:HD domain-containing phosphohydrolase n=1 Tax=Magnetococcus sp. PR-3 TaxID=3120355 RepID=UPI003FA5A010
MRGISHLLSWANPSAYLRAARLRAFMEGMVEELQIKGGWQLNLAATLSQIGCVALPKEEIAQFNSGRGVSVKYLNLFRKHPEIGAQTLASVPRMGTVSRIVKHQNDPLPESESYPEALEKRGIYLLGRQVLKLLLDFDHKLLGEKSTRALKSMAKDEQYDTLLVEALERVISKMEWISCALEPKKMMPGMVLEESVALPNKTGVLRKGTVLDQHTVGRIMVAFDDPMDFSLLRVKVPFKVDADGNLPISPVLFQAASCELEDKPKREVPKILVDPLIKKLFAAVKDDDPIAQESCDKLLECLANTEAESIIQQIHAQVHAYDFPSAVGLVHELAETVEISLE